ncbi:MAG: 4Fe-4S binding protein [Chloroflexota bacterium]
MDADEPPYIDIERCFDCRLCVPACPFEALWIAGDSRLSFQTMAENRGV